MKDQHIPKVYIALDKSELQELEQKIQDYRNQGNWEKAQGIQESIDWIKSRDIYTRPY